jgi:hypothetical protein
MHFVLSTTLSPLWQRELSVCTASSIELFGLRMLLQTRQHKANKKALSEFFIGVKNIGASQPLTSRKDRNHHR